MKHYLNVFQTLYNIDLLVQVKCLTDWRVYYASSAHFLKGSAKRNQFVYTFFIIIITNQRIHIFPIFKFNNAIILK